MTIIVSLLVLTGVFFFIVGTIGLLRLPDTYSRIHAPTKCDTLGLGLVVFGLVLHSGFSVASVKLIFILVFLWMTSPTSATAISKAAMESGIEFSEDSFFYHQDDLKRGSDQD